MLSRAEFKADHFFPNNGREQKLGQLFVIHEVFENHIVDRIRDLHHILKHISP